MSDNLVIGGATFNNVAGIKATNTDDDVLTFMNSVIETYSITLTAELNSYNILQAMGAKLKYKYSAVMMFIVSTSAAVDGGAYTNNNYYLVHNGTTINRCGLLQKSGKLAPNLLAFFLNPVDTSSTWYESMTKSFINADGTFSFRATTATVLAPVGAVCITVEVPNKAADGQFDLTPFGS